MVTIVYSSSNSYIKCTCVSLCSLFENNSNIDSLKVVLISSDIDTENTEKVLSVCERYGRNIEIIDATNLLLDFAIQLNLPEFRGSYAVYASLIMADILPDCDRAIFIDSDTLILGNLEPLWTQNLEDKVIGAVPEVALYSKISSSEDIDILYGSELYFNSGVLLYDLKSWRFFNIRSQLSNFILKAQRNYKIVDQSILNDFFKDGICRLHLKYNYYTAVHGIRYETLKRNFPVKDVFGRKEFDETKHNPVIVHFVGFPFERPWFRLGESPYKKIYLDYLNKTPWAYDALDEFEFSPNLIIAMYDKFSMILRRVSLYDAYHTYRYVLGQYLKKITQISR